MSQNSPEIPADDDQDPKTECVGGEPFADCPTAEALMRLTERFRSQKRRYAGEGKYNHLLMDEYMLGCIACQKVCYLARKMENRRPTKMVRMEILDDST